MRKFRLKNRIRQRLCSREIRSLFRKFSEGKVDPMEIDKPIRKGLVKSYGECKKKNIPVNGLSDVRDRWEKQSLLAMVGSFATSLILWGNSVIMLFSVLKTPDVNKIYASVAIATVSLSAALGVVFMGVGIWMKRKLRTR